MSKRKPAGILPSKEWLRANGHADVVDWMFQSALFAVKPSERHMIRRERIKHWSARLGSIKRKAEGGMTPSRTYPNQVS